MRAFLIFAVLGLAVLPGCGGDDDKASQPTDAQRAETQATSTTPTTAERPAETDAEDATGETSTDESSSGSGGSGGSSGSSGGTTTPAPREFQPLEGSDRSQASAEVRAFFAALADRDGARICSHLASITKRQFVRSLGQAPRLKGKDCAELLELTTRTQPAALTNGFKQVRVTALFFKDDFALARYKVPGDPLAVIPLTKDTDGRWRVSALGGTPSDRVPIP
jgi:hypothetical protein